jgi:predicted small lipoprotein YifL
MTAPVTLLKKLSFMGLGLAIAVSMSACGREGPLEKAPPIFDKNGKEVKRETEKALPTAKGKNNSPDPYTTNVPVRSQPLEGTGNAQGHN